MFNRRQFLHTSFLTSLGLLFKRSCELPAIGTPKDNPIVISTWGQNQKANEVAWKILSSGGSSIDAVESGVMVPEADPNDMSVGYGGLPDRDGKVTLDACIMDHHANCGSVMFLEGIKHPIKVARLVMEKTPHVQLVGEGALQFALQNGFRVEDLLTKASEAAWKEWLKKSDYDPMTIPRLLKKKNLPGQADNHDTIGMIAMDANGNLGGACTTSGMAFKMRGRVGDSPIIGAGLFVDNEVGAATATGVGEEVVRICGTHTVVEYMRQGFSPEQACKKAVERIIQKRGKKAREFQVGFISINKKGEAGAYSIQKGFSYALHSKKGPKIIDSKYFY